MEITELLAEVRRGDREALNRLVPLINGELRRLARNRLRAEHTGHTLQPTDLIHEAYIRLLQGKQPEWASRTHFFAIAARLMRQVLVDYARARRAQKRGPGLQIPLDDSPTPATQPHGDLLAIDEAMNRLAAEDPHLVTLIEMRFFAGMTAEETADALNQSVHVVRHEIRYALAWLRRVLDPTPES